MASPDDWAGVVDDDGAAEGGVAGAAVSDRLAADSAGGAGGWAAGLVDSAWGGGVGSADSVAVAAVVAALEDPGRVCGRWFVVSGWWFARVDRLRFRSVGVAYDDDADSQDRSDGAVGGAVDRSLRLFVQSVRQP